MKKSILFFLISILATANLHAFSGKGSGTEADPFQITNVKQLQEIENNLDAHYILMNDIDASETKFWNNIDHDNDSTTPMKAMGFVPIGYHSPGTTLILDGKNHSIKNLFMITTGQVGVGLFAETRMKWVIRNISLVDCNIDGPGQVGGLVGNNGGRVINSSASGTVTSYGTTGGLVGWNSGGIVNSSADVEMAVKSHGRNIGGLVGYNKGFVDLSHATGTVKPKDKTASFLGGLVGNNLGIIRNSFASTDVSGDTCVGGLIGMSSGKIFYSYSIGKVVASKNVGGLGADTFKDAVFKCFWDIESSEHETSSGGTGKTTAEMKDKSTFTDAGWNFDFIWGIDENINNGYPYIKYDKSYHPTDSDGDGYINLSTFTDLHWFSEGGFNQHNKWELDNNIDATEAKYLNDGRGFWPVGTSYNPFNGIFNGNGYSISNIFINRPGTDNVGLFGSTNYLGEIRNVGAENLEIVGDENVGGLVGYNRAVVANSHTSGKITGCQYTGGIIGNNYRNIVNLHADCNILGVLNANGGHGDYCGGLVGSNESDINQCSASGDVIGEGVCGGLVGSNMRGIISLSYATGSVSSGTRTGGLVGSNERPCVIKKCYATGDVSGKDATGGLVGDNDGGIINTYARGSVVGEQNIGGLVGSMEYEVSEAYIQKSYATGRIKSDNKERVGGIIGYPYSKENIHQSLWDSVTSGIGTSYGGYGKNTAQMKTKSTFTTFGFGFNTIWSIDPDINDGYPYLQIKTVSVQESPEASKIGISLYPNPANEFVKISIKDEGAIILNVRIVDLFGRLIKEGDVGAVSREIIIPVSEITGGYYLIRIQTNREYISLPLIVE